jgi:hypothetical protein
MLAIGGVWRSTELRVLDLHLYWASRGRSHTADYAHYTCT